MFFMKECLSDQKIKAVLKNTMLVDFLKLRRNRIVIIDTMFNHSLGQGQLCWQLSSN